MLFLDSSRLAEIQEFYTYHLICGVTTNPSIMFKDGVSDIDKTIAEIAELIYPYPTSVEVMSNNNKYDMVTEALRLSKISDNVVVKIPVHGPNGELFNLAVIHELFNYTVKVNATCIMNTAQAYAAACAGATYVSLFGGRVANMGYDTIAEIKRVKKHVSSLLILGSVREPSNLLDWAEAGADIITVSPEILRQWLVHPATKDVVSQFLTDAKRVTNGQ